MHELSNDEIDDMMIWPAPRLNESARHAVRSAYAAGYRAAQAEAPPQEPTAQAADPAADPIADLCARLRGYNPPDRTIDAQRQMAQDIAEAADALERLARTERLLQACVRHETARAERAEAERDALRECVRAADQTARFDLAWLISAINVHRHLPRPVGPELPKWYAENDRWLREASEMLNKIYSAENTPGSAAQPAAQRAPVRVPCPNKVDGVCPLPNVHCAYPKCTEGTAPLSHVTPAGPPAPRAQAATDDLVARLSVCAPSSVADDAIAELQRQAREIADLTRLQERNEVRIKAIVDDALLQRAERAEAERDALREVVRAADAIWKTVSQTPDRTYAMAAYSTARAKVKP